MPNFKVETFRCSRKLAFTCCRQRKETVSSLCWAEPCAVHPARPLHGHGDGGRLPAPRRATEQAAARSSHEGAVECRMGFAGPRLLPGVSQAWLLLQRARRAARKDCSIHAWTHAKSYNNSLWRSKSPCAYVHVHGESQLSEVVFGPGRLSFTRRSLSCTAERTAACQRTCAHAALAAAAWTLCACPCVTEV